MLVTPSFGRAKADGEWPDHYTVSDHGVVSATLAAQETEPQVIANTLSHNAHALCQHGVSDNCPGAPRVCNLERLSIA
eukprot:5346618-Amphidinium_carterae.2